MSHLTCRYFSGAVASSQRSLDYVLGRGQGNAVGVVLGGAEEVLDTHADSFDLNLMKRRGFVKVALRNGFVILYLSRSSCFLIDFSLLQCIFSANL